jgi:Protein of unknown function (DUF1236)
MSNRFLVSVATIALIAGAGAANAQGTGNRESGGAAMQHSAPSGTTATPAARDSGGSSDMKSSQSEQAAPGAAKGQRAEESAPGQKSKGMSSQNETKGGKDMKAETREGETGNMKAEGRESRDNNMKAEGREGRDNSKMNAESREGRDNGKMNAESREGRDNTKMNAETKTGGERSQTTTGQAGASARLTTEQRTRITTVIRNEHVAPVTSVNFNVAVGTRVPRDVSFHPLPADVVTIYPEWRGYNFILVRDEIVVIDPATFEIIAILNT